MYFLKVFEAFVEKESGVIHKHVDELHKLVPVLRFNNHHLTVNWTVPQALEDVRDVVADGKFIVEFSALTSRLDIDVELH